MKILNKLSLKAKLNLLNGTLALFLLLVSAVAQFGIHSSNLIIEQLSSNESSHWLNQSLIVKSDIQVAVRVAFEPYAEGKPVAAAPIKDANDSIKTFEQNLDKFAAESKFSPEESTKFNKLKDQWKTIKENLTLILKNMQEAKLKREEINAQILKTEDAFLNINDILSEILAGNRKKTLELHTTAQFKEKIYFAGLLTLLLLTITISIISFVFTIRLNRSFKKLSTDLFNRSKEITTVVSSLKDSSDSLNSAINEQSHSIHDTTAAINQMNSTVNNTTLNTRELFDVSKSSLERADSGKLIMSNLVTAMEEIHKSNEQLQEISQIITQINTKTAVINDIVSKTELLSLNASIESARAGEQGKGFAVVAEEVGNLAKISGKSSKEIQDLISKSEEQVSRIIDQTKKRVDDVKEVTNNAQKSFEDISENISSLSNFIEKITMATQEQEIGIKQVSSAMENIERSTTNIQKSIGVTSNCSENLVEQGNKLEFASKDIEKLISGY